MRDRLRAALAIAGALLGCHRGSPSPPVRVGALEVVDRSSPAIVDRADVTRRVAAALRKGGFEVPPEVERGAGERGQKDWRCRAEVAAAAEGQGAGSVAHAWAQIECSLPEVSAEPLSARALGDQPLSGEGDAKAKLQTLAARLAEDTTALVVKQERLRTGPVAELQRALADPDADVRRQAVRAAAQRRAREAVPALINLLDDSEADLHDMALGALADIADPNAVKPLTSRVKFQDTEELRKILDPVAAMGGEEARAFLEFVASGHEDADIRKLARRALERMERRAQAAAAAAQKRE
jgi:hypothetical protein